MHRSRSPILLLTLPFAASVLGSWAWFNLDFGPRLSTLDSGQPPRLWLSTLDGSLMNRQTDGPAYGSADAAAHRTTGPERDAA